MIKVRKSSERGYANLVWLETHHSFSFADYYDSNYMGYGVLRVINEDYVLGGTGFPLHSHRDMEIITYVVDGLLEHKDSMGNTSLIRPGEVQYMCAGTGVRHSEYNADREKTVHLLQIWILPDKSGHVPRYGQKSFMQEFSSVNNFVLVASGDGRLGSIQIHQALDLYAVKANTGGHKEFTTTYPRQWLQVISGDVTVNEITLRQGDGAAMSDNNETKISWSPGSEFLFFDMN